MYTVYIKICVQYSGHSVVEQLISVNLDAHSVFSATEMGEALL